MRKHKLEMIVTMIDGESTENIIKELKEAVESGEFQRATIDSNEDIIGCEATFTVLE